MGHSLFKAKAILMWEIKHEKMTKMVNLGQVTPFLLSLKHPQQLTNTVLINICESLIKYNAFTCRQRDSNQPPKLLDEEERQLRLESRQRKFREYRISRQEMLLVRNQDREARNMAKAKQLEVAAEWQVQSNPRYY